MPRFTVVLPQEAYVKLMELTHAKKVAGELKASMSDLVREAVDAYLKNSPRKS